MTHGFDYKTIRILTYVTLVMLIANVVNAVCYVFFMIPALIVCDMMRFLAVMGVALCLYRIAEISKYIAGAAITLMSFAFTSIVTRTLYWMSYHGQEWLFMMSVYFGIISEIIIMVGVIMMLHGFSEECVNMQKKNMIPGIRKAAILWIVTEILITLICSSSMILLATIGRQSNLVRALYILIIVVYAVAEGYLFLRCREFCYEYYMYSYSMSRKTVD